MLRPCPASILLHLLVHTHTLLIYRNTMPFDLIVRLAPPSHHLRLTAILPDLQLPSCVLARRVESSFLRSQISGVIAWMAFTIG